MKKGSITIFITFSMVFVSSVLFLLIEGMRYQETKRIGQLQTELAVESFFAGYDLNLWKEYRLLGSDDAMILRQLEDSGNARVKANAYGLNLLQLKVKKIQMESVTRITDGEGAAFIHAISTYMEKEVLYATLKSIYNQYEAIRSLIQSGEINRSTIDEALKNIQVIQSQLQEGNSLGSDSLDAELDDTEQNLSPQIENPLEVIKNLQKMGVLELLISNTGIVSDKQIQQNEIVSKRNLQKGKNAQISESSWLDKVLFQQYLLSYFSNYCSNGETAGLSYELEYILIGNSHDIENLKQVAQQLIGIREVLNFLYLMSNTQAQEEAGLLAVALVGATVNPIVIETVKIGILTAWAFGESVLDVRALLKNRKIPLIKSKDTWTLALTDLGRIAQMDYISKESAMGLRYTDYLGILVFFQEENRLAMRAMDLQEINIRNKYKETGFRMDHLCIQSDVTICYVYRKIFNIFANLSDVTFWKDEIFTRASFSYY